MRIGFDLGGTKMLAVAFEEDGTVIARQKQRTEPGDNEAVLAQITDTIEGLLAGIRDTGRSVPDRIPLGVAAPGPIDFGAGIILQTPNLFIRNLPLADRLTDAFGFPVLLENDVNAGLWGEYVAGAARGYRHVVGLFPGTGLGGGLILGGQLYRGKRGGAGEIGHIVVQSDGRRCGCGNYGCLETVASKTAIARDLVMLAMNGQAPTIAAAGGTDIRAIKSGLIAKAIAAGEQAVIDVVDRAAEFLGIGMAAVVNTFDPELIVVGGGLVDKLGSQYLNTAERMMRARAMARLVEDVTVAPAELGDLAAAVGAADLAERRTDE